MPLFNTPSAGFQLPPELNRPPLMAIGDSIYNGMRSVTVTETLAKLSIPAQIAHQIAPTYTFLHPAYPEAVLVDVEAALHRFEIATILDDYENLKTAVRQNALRWVNWQNVLKNHLLFDNLSIAGGLVADLIDLSTESGKQQLNKMRPVIQAQTDPFTWSGPDWGLVDVHMAINRCFILNPSNNPALDGLTPVDQVQLRKPDRLLIDIGPNHGLINITCFGDVDGGKKMLNDFVGEMKRLAPYLVALDVGRIYFNSLPKPSAVPNLMPPYQKGDMVPPQNALGYYPEYENRLGMLNDYRLYSAEEMKEIDDFVAGINQQVADVLTDAFQGSNRLRFFDLYAAMAKFDGKHDPHKGVKLPPTASHNSERTYSNKALEVDFNPVPFDDSGFFRTGGIAGLDNHHPSTLGYTLFGNELLSVISAAEGMQYPPIVPSDLQDSLLNDLPNFWFFAPLALLDIRRMLAKAPGTSATGPTMTAGVSEQQKRTTADLMSHLVAIGGRTREVESPIVSAGVLAMPDFYILVMDRYSQDPANWQYSNSAKTAQELTQLPCFSDPPHALPKASFRSVSSVRISLRPCATAGAPAEPGTIYGIQHV